MDELMDAGRDDAEDAEVLPFRDVDGFELRVGGHQPSGSVPSTTELLDGEIAVKHGDDDGSVSRREAFIDDENVSRLNSRSRHGIAASANKERCRWAVNQQVVQIQRFFNVCFRW